MNRIIIAVLLTLGVNAYAGSDVLFSLSDFASGDMSNRLFRLTPTSAPGASGTNIIVGDTLSYRTPTNSGSLYVSNMVGGYYRVEVIGRGVTQFRILVPSNGVYNASDLIVENASVAGYSQAAADAKFVLKTSGKATNLNVYGYLKLDGVDVGTGGGGITLSQASNQAYQVFIARSNIVLPWWASGTESNLLYDAAKAYADTLSLANTNGGVTAPVATNIAATIAADTNIALLATMTTQSNALMNSKAPRTLYVETNGNDTTGKPYRTLEAAHAVAVAGDTIIIGSGTFSNVATVFLKPISVIGAGYNKTKILSVATWNFVLTNDCFVSDLSLIMADNATSFPIATAGAGCTNARVQHVYTEGYSDSIVVLGPVTNTTFHACHFRTAFDNFAHNSSTYGYLRFDDCYFEADGNIRGTCPTTHNIASFTGEMILDNCVLKCVALSSGGSAYNIGCSSSNLSRFILNNCTLIYTNTDTTPYNGSIKNMFEDDEFNRAPGLPEQIVLNGTYDTKRIWGPVILNGNIIWGNGQALGSSISNTNEVVSVGYGDKAMTVDTNGAVNIKGVLTGDGSGLTNITSTPSTGILSINDDTNSAQGIGGELPISAVTVGGITTISSRQADAINSGHLAASNYVEFASKANTNAPVLTDPIINGTLTINGTFSAGTLTVTNPIGVASGGTGTSNWTAGKIPLGQGTNAPVFLGIGNGLTTNGGNLVVDTTKVATTNANIAAFTGTLLPAQVAASSEAGKIAAVKDATSWEWVDRMSSATVTNISKAAVSNSLYYAKSTNVASATALTVDMDVPTTVVFMTNTLVLTNFVGALPGTSKSKLFILIPQASAQTLTLGAAGASYGMYRYTNCPPTANQPYGSVTNGSVYALSITTFDTNYLASMTEWK